MLIIGLTGGIGSGKSTVAERFHALGVDYVDADIIAREVVAPGEPALSAIAEHFGPEALLADGNLNRPWLRQAIFADPALRTWLEQLLHPLIRERTQQQLLNARSDYALLVSPLLLETDQHQLVDLVVVVDLPESQQIARTVSRDVNSEAQVKAILAAQMPREKRLQRADRVIDNSGSPEALTAQVLHLHQEFTQMAKRTR